MNVDNFNSDNIATVITKMIENGIIRNQTELVSSLGFSKGAISNILSGNKKTGTDFNKEIEQNKNAESVYVKQLLGKIKELEDENVMLRRLVTKP